MVRGENCQVKEGSEVQAMGLAIEQDVYTPVGATELAPQSPQSPNQAP